MANGQRHIDDNGNISICRVTTGVCPYAGRGHFDSRDEAETAYGELQSEGSVPSSLKRKRDPKSQGFSEDSFYGEMPPRTIQIDALNETANALLEDGNTQLVAACGTGKSYMGRQLMRRMMEEEDANGVAIVLTSSRKLAIDTAADLRPEGGYDQAIGQYGRDYGVEVIEIHSDSKDGIKENGAVSPEKIAERWRDALDAGKKVVIVSTYQSSSKVQEVQELIGDRATADLLMNDEAHNILGQKDSVSSDEAAKNSGYRSFANEIPGSIQSKHRLYATATPPLADSPDDDESSAQGDSREEQIEALKGQVERMGANGRKRLTVYSDDELIVGRVSGAITQQEAISEGYLTKPDYQLRAALVRGDSSWGGFVDASGSYTAGSDSADGVRSMTPQTYAAVSATLQAMASDPATGDDGVLKNPTHNALVYAGSIDQARAFRDNFRSVAIEQSGNISLEEAERNRDSSDPELKRRARMKLLAENAEAVAAYSGESREVKAERQRAFGMFKGKDYRAEDAQRGWSPDKRVLANVDIFSEGISLNEIDTVVISDSAKTSERAMTQAIGRSLRTVGGNEQKNTGHVIIPQVLNESGKELNGGLVTAASYGATRVERAVSTRKLKGESVAADESTRIARYDASGKQGDSELAASIAKTHVNSAERLLASQVMERAHTSLMAKTSPEKRREAERYATLSASERLEEQRTFIGNQAGNPRVKDSSWAIADGALKHISNSDMPTVRQSGRVITSALSAGDFSAVPASVTDRLSRAGIIRKREGVTDGPTLAEKRELALGSSRAVATAFALQGGQQAHPELAAKIGSGVNLKEANMYSMTKGRRGSAEQFEKLVGNYEALVAKDSGAVETIFSSIDTSQKDSKAAPASLSGILRQNGGEGLRSGMADLHERTASRASAAAASGSAEYELDPAMVSRNGVLKASAQRKLAEIL